MAERIALTSEQEYITALPLHCWPQRTIRYIIFLILMSLFPFLIHSFPETRTGFAYMPGVLIRLQATAVSCTILPTCLILNLPGHCKSFMGMTVMVIRCLTSITFMCRY